MTGEFDWVLKPVSSEESVRELGRSLNDLPDALSRALLLRGIRSFEEARHYFRGGVGALHDPLLMADMVAARDRVIRAVREREQVVVYGDYDVDGTSATALMTHFLRSRGVPATYFIPDRIRHGYGLGTAGLDEAAGRGARLVIALDCGVTALREAEYAASLGLDLVVCDHHTPLDELPQAVAVLDPKRSDCGYPFNELCGCAVAFKLASAVATELDGSDEDAQQYLDLVALATAADVVPLRGENRILLREGLRAIREQPRLGLRALAEEANVRLTECNTRAIQFGLAPRINAAGRLGDAKRAVKLLLTDDDHEAAARARQLERVNIDRRALDRSVLEAAEARTAELLESGDLHAIVLHDASWHLGVVGIVAARLVERFHKPAILLGQANGLAKGSARSIGGINIYDAIQTCSDLLESFGGHDYAAGLSMKPENVALFSGRLNEAVAAAASGEPTLRRLEVDAEMDLEDLDDRFWAVLSQFEPYGEDNDPPVFVARGVTVAGPPGCVGREREHLKFRVAGTGRGSLDVIAFRQGDKLNVLADAVAESSRIDLAFELSENTWNGVRSLQLQARDIRPSTRD